MKIKELSSKYIFFIGNLNIIFSVKSLNTKFLMEIKKTSEVNIIFN